MPTLRAAAAAVSLARETAGRWDSEHGALPESYEADLRATALILEAEQPVCLVSCDALTVPQEAADEGMRRIEAETGIPASNLLICATHTHHGPCTIDFLGCRPDEEFCRRLKDGIVQAALAAHQRLHGPQADPGQAEVELLLGVGQEATIGRNSRLLLRDGTIGWYGYAEADVVRPTGPYDPDLHVLAFRRAGGGLAGLVFNHSVHNIGTRAPEPQRVRSPGFYGLTAQELERRHGAAALFLPGAFGSTHNITFTGSGVPGAECVVRLSDALERALRDATPALPGPVQCVKRPFTYHLRHFDEAREAEATEFYLRKYTGAQADRHIEIFRQMRAELAPLQGQERQSWLQVIRLGKVALVGVPGELFARLGLAIRRRSPFRHTCIIGLANEELGYIPDVEAYELGGYQLWTGWHSRLEPGTGEALVDQAVALLEELHSADAG